MNYSDCVRCGSLVSAEYEPRDCFDGACVGKGVAQHAPEPAHAKGLAPSKRSGVFPLAVRSWTTSPERQAPEGSRRLMGFSVMRSPDRGPFKVGRRIASQAPLNRLGQCSDAAAPEGKEASNPNRVSFAFAPQLLTRRQTMEIDLPVWVDRDAWAAFVDMRSAKGKRAPFTVLAAKRLLYELDRFRSQGNNPTEVIWQSVVNGWSGFYALKVKHFEPPQPKPFQREPEQVLDPARKAEIAELLRRTRNNLTRH